MPGLPPAKTFMTVYRKPFPWISRPLNTWRTCVKGHILTLFSISGTWFSFSLDIYSYVRGLVIGSCSENNHRSMSRELISCVYSHSQFTQELVKWAKKYVFRLSEVSEKYQPSVWTKPKQGISAGHTHRLCLATKLRQSLKWPHTWKVH